MIKIELRGNKREKIEKLFLEDLVEGTQKGKRGKLIEDLDTKDSRNLLRRYNHALYDFLYDNAGKPNTDNVKELLLAGRKRMEEFIRQFPPNRSSPKPDELLATAFRYKNFSNRKVVNEILREMEIPVCPYCNRLYITVLKRKKVRPQLDHFFPKSLYPYLALSLYNLVPSCGVCNQAKADWNTYKTPLLYPYEEEFGEEVVFTLNLRDKSDFVRKMRGDSSQIRVEICNSSHSPDLKQKVTKQDELLHLTDLYGEHGDYVADILKSYHINTETRVEELLQCLPELFSSRDEVRSIMFMNNVSHDQWGRRPLAKLTHDILWELDSLMH